MPQAVARQRRAAYWRAAYWRRGPQPAARKAAASRMKPANVSKLPDRRAINSLAKTPRTINDYAKRVPKPKPQLILGRDNAR